MSEELKPKVEMVTITINDTEIQVPKGELLVESAKRMGIDIPIFCYHPRMEPVAMCRMCLVEIGTKQPDGTVRKMPKPQTACSLPAQDNLVMYTDTEQIKLDRKGIVEFLLINHPLDCPICDRGGECPLQNNTLAYGPGKTRFIEEKRHEVKAFPLSEYVVLDRERCIQCGRCTRFTEEISGDGQLAFLFRGNDMKISTFEETRFTSKFSGNTIEICPVGALTNRKYRFRARPWDLKTQKSVCTLCSNGCNVHLDTRLNQFIRLNGRTNEAVNEEWTCDKGKFGAFFLNSEKRLTEPLIRDLHGDLVPATWPEAYDLILNKFSHAHPSAIAGMGGERTSNEDNWMFQKLFRAGFGSNNLDHRMYRYQAPVHQGMFQRLGAYMNMNSIQELEDAKTIFIIGSSLADEQPIVYLRARKAWKKCGAKVIYAHHQETEVDEFSDVDLHYRYGTELALLGGLLHQVSRLMATSNTVQSSGFTNFIASVGEYTTEWTERETGVKPSLLKHAAEVIFNGESCIILAGEFIQNHPFASGIIEALSNFAVLTKSKSGKPFGLNLMSRACNSHGAADMGILPDTLPGYKLTSDAETRLSFEKLWGSPIPAKDGLNSQAILEGAANKSIESLYLMGCNPLTSYYDNSTAQRAMEGINFLVVQDILASDLMEYAHVVLPAASYAEREGTFTNLERRVQRFRRGLESSPNVKHDWNILAELYIRQQSRRGLKSTPPPFNAKEVMQEIIEAVPQYNGCGYHEIPEEGFRWQYAESKELLELLPVRPIPILELI